jgi:hypothetical protein
MMTQSMNIRMPDLAGVKKDKIKQVLPKLVQYTIQGASAQLKDQRKWFLRFDQVAPYCNGDGPFMIFFNLQCEVEDANSISPVEIAKIIEEVIVGHWNFNVDEMKNKVKPYWG